MTSAPVRGLRPMPVLRGLTVKTPKPRSSMRSPCDEALLHAVEDGVDRGFGFGSRKAGAFDDPLDEVLFDHDGSPSLIDVECSRKWCECVYDRLMVETRKRDCQR